MWLPDLGQILQLPALCMDYRYHSVLAGKMVSISEVLRLSVRSMSPTYLMILVMIFAIIPVLTMITLAGITPTTQETLCRIHH